MLFLLYHYFEAKEIYNAIRVFIAGYVWMTGFGNFSYYYKFKDFTFGRYCHLGMFKLCCWLMHDMPWQNVFDARHAKRRQLLPSLIVDLPFPFL